MPHKMSAAWIHLVTTGQERFTIQRPVTSVSAYPGIYEKRDQPLDDAQQERPVARVISVELEHYPETCAGSQRKSCDQDVQELQEQIVGEHWVSHWHRVHLSHQS
jgi:hypothetical protein